MMIDVKGILSCFLLLLFLLPGNLLEGQRRDFQTWHELGLETDLDPGITLIGELEQRFRQNSTRYDRTLATLSAEYDLNGYLRTAGGVRMLLAADDEFRVHPRYRVHADLQARHELYTVQFSLRARFQYGFEEFASLGDLEDNSLVNRIRLRATHHFFGTRTGVFTSLESWGRFGSTDGRFFKRIRFVAGASYDLNFRSSLSLQYIMEDEFNQPDPLTSHILAFGYAYRF